MIAIRPAQKKIVIVASSGALIFFAFTAFLYVPNKKNAVLLKKELESVKEEIRSIEKIAGGADATGTAIEIFGKRRQELRGKFTSGEKEGLEMISTLAREKSIDVISLTPQPKKIYEGEQSQRLEADGKFVYEVSVTVEAQCLYKDLVAYMEALNRSPQIFAIVEKLNIVKERGSTFRLNVILDIDLYLLS